VVDKVAARESVAVNADASAFVGKMRKMWVERGGELIKLPPDEQAAMMKTLGAVGEDVSKSKPALNAAYHVAVEAAKRAKH
jgi:hypothetical protein